VFLGNAEEAVVPFVLPDDAFGRLANANAVSVTIDTNAHLAAYAALGPGVNHLPTIPNNAAGERVRPCQVIVLPQNMRQTLIPRLTAAWPLSSEFWTQVVQPLVNADPVVNKTIIDWWKAAAALNGNDHHMSVATPQPAVADLTFWGWSHHTAATLLSHLPSVNGPGLNQVVTDVSRVARQLQDTEQARVDEATSRANMTFSQRFGTPLANVVLRLCRVGTDA